MRDMRCGYVFMSVLAVILAVGVQNNINSNRSIRQDINGLLDEARVQNKNFVEISRDLNELLAKAQKPAVKVDEPDNIIRFSVNYSPIGERDNIQADQLLEKMQLAVTRHILNGERKQAIKQEAQLLYGMSCSVWSTPKEQREERFDAMRRHVQHLCEKTNLLSGLLSEEKIAWIKCMLLTPNNVTLDPEMIGYSMAEADRWYRDTLDLPLSAQKDLAYYALDTARENLRIRLLASLNEAARTGVVPGSKR